MPMTVEINASLLREDPDPDTLVRHLLYQGLNDLSDAEDQRAAAEFLQAFLRRDHKRMDGIRGHERLWHDRRVAGIVYDALCDSVKHVNEDRYRSSNETLFQIIIEKAAQACASRAETRKRTYHAKFASEAVSATKQKILERGDR